MRILIVEDEYKIANSIKRGLEQEGYAVDVVYDGNEGYDMAMGETYDVIILDILLPGMNGIEICKRIREEKVYTPILLLTALGRINDKVEGLNSGADDYLVKPFAFEELLARIRALSRRPRNLDETKLKVNDLELETLNFEVKRGNKKINLTKREFSLLEYLMRNKGRVLTKDQIIAHVWDYNSDILPNTVEVYISYLREKIDKPFPNRKSLIHTVRGFGYKIAENER